MHTIQIQMNKIAPVDIVLIVFVIFSALACLAGSGTAEQGMKAFVFADIGALVYLVPSLVGRDKKNSGAILVLNIFLGWTFIGWVIALVWACTKE